MSLAPDQPSGANGLKVLAHIREQYSLSPLAAMPPRMTMELKEAGLDVGERRVGRLMAVKGLTDDEIARIIGWTTKRVASIRARYVDEARVVIALIERLSA
ncbi:hypothetical protein [Altericroceibacterium spongiae]|uniref:hypothetical protein n=1 Tax=Altericroceibacterium spongiae TaxID=2320269 RepID=UPI001AECDF98|nr:hypothetical protein [Altericroceibacterium spongiae]